MAAMNAASIGTATTQRADDGTVIVVQADPVILVNRVLLVEIGPPHVDPADPYRLQLDTAGEYVYRRAGATVEGLIYEREL